LDCPAEERSSCEATPLHDRNTDRETEPPENPVALVQRIAAGDRDAFARFYDRYASLVFTFAMRLLRVPAEAEDLLQEVFLQVWRQAHSYQQERGSPEAWMITITRSRAIDKLRSLRRRDEGAVSLPASSRVEEGGKVESGAPEAEARLMVQSALARLPDAQRLVMELAYFDGLTQSEIATRLGEPLGTVKTRLRAGLERLRTFLGAKTTGESL
jgi:RNA polymerase sigma-70 factor (ECF subfamily)